MPIWKAFIDKLRLTFDYYSVENSQSDQTTNNSWVEFHVYSGSEHVFYFGLNIHKILFSPVQSGLPTISILYFISHFMCWCFLLGLLMQSFSRHSIECGWISCLCLIHESLSVLVSGGLREVLSHGMFSGPCIRQSGTSAWNFLDQFRSLFLLVFIFLFSCWIATHDPNRPVCSFDHSV